MHCYGLDVGEFAVPGPCVEAQRAYFLRILYSIFTMQSPFYALFRFLYSPLSLFFSASGYGFLLQNHFIFYFVMLVSVRVALLFHFCLPFDMFVALIYHFQLFVLSAPCSCLQWKFFFFYDSVRCVQQQGGLTLSIFHFSFCILHFLYYLLYALFYYPYFSFSYSLQLGKVLLFVRCVAYHYFSFSFFFFFKITLP